MNSFTTFISQLFIISLVAVFTLSCKQPASEKLKNNTMKINWNKLSTAGLNGDLTKGVSASYAALINGKLIVAGGANFPGKLGFEGGAKAFYDEVLIYDNTSEDWKVIGRLPTPSAYGVSVSVSEGALWIGGNNEKESLKSCYKLSLSPNNEISLKPLVDLPFPMDNFSGCSINETVFVGGGIVDGKSSNKFYCLDTKTDSEWVELPDYPGIPRVQPVLVALETEGKTYIYLLGGLFGGDENQEPAMATDILRFDVAENVWSVVGEQIDPETGNPFSLGGATAFAINNRYIICLGGVNYDIFLDAITTQYNIGFDSKLTPEEKKEKNLNFSKHYMTQPVEYYKFNTECRVYDTHTGEWITIDNTTNSARAGATLVTDGNRFYAVQGELKPGLRTSISYMGEVVTE